MILPEATLNVCGEVRCKSIHCFPFQESLTTKKLPFEVNSVLSNVVNLLLEPTHYLYLITDLYVPGIIHRSQFELDYFSPFITFSYGISHCLSLFLKNHITMIFKNTCLSPSVLKVE